MIAAIHQPNFFPWLGYFDKVARSEVFVVLDDVQYQKTGSSWSNRVKLLVAGEPRWVTAPVQRPAHGTARICDLAWAGGTWRAKLVRTLATSYGAAPHFAETIRLLEPVITCPEQSVVRYNVNALTVLCAALEIQCNLVLASTFEVGESSNERLIALCRHVGCETYLAGGGAQDYQQDSLFAAAGITVRYQAFRHPEYVQHASGEFVPGLSIIDALMNLGIAGTSQLLAISAVRPVGQNRFQP